MERPCNTEPPTEAHRRLAPKKKGDYHMSTHELENKIRELRQLRQLIAEAEAEVETITDTIKRHMGDTEELFAGEYRITWKPVQSVRIDTAELKRALPEIAEAFTRKSTTRRFVVA